jgi:hypothetical protein
MRAMALFAQEDDRWILTLAGTQARGKLGCRFDLPAASNHWLGGRIHAGRG